MYRPIKRWDGKEKKKDSRGYTIVKIPGHPKAFCGGFYYEHRLVYESILGRCLETWETVHHISENKCDNSIRNLFLCTRTEHDRAVWLTYRAS